MVRSEGGAHRVLLFREADEFVDAAEAFVRRGLDRGERVIAATFGPKLDRLRERLRGDGPAVTLMDSAARSQQMGRLYGEVCRALQRRGDLGDRPVRVVAEQPLNGMRSWELRAHFRFETAAGPLTAELGGEVLCSYDTGLLPEAVLEGARRTHTEVVEDGRSGPGTGSGDARAAIRRIHGGHRPPAGSEGQALGDQEELAAARRVVRTRASAAGVAADAVDDLVLALSEVATNAVVHGRPPQRLWTYEEDDCFVCQVHDAGMGPVDPLVGYLPPGSGGGGGRGLWLAHQLCDAAEIVTDQSGTDVVLRMRR